VSKSACERQKPHKPFQFYLETDASCAPTKFSRISGMMVSEISDRSSSDL